jgi:hypothetical protein
MRRHNVSSVSVAAVLFGLAFLGAGCGGGSPSSSNPDGAAGTTGSGGAAGTTGSGGAAGTTGSGGAAGTTGSGGAGGTTGSGGAAGTTGSGGAAGVGGVAGTAGTSGTGGGSAGNSGAAGAAGHGGAAGAAAGAGGSAAGGSGAGGSGTAGSGTAGSGAGGAGNNACAPGARSCGPNSDVEICNASGTSTLYLQTCANACSNGLCTGACTPGATRCNGSGTTDILEQCDAAGATWQLAQTCPSYCDARNLTCARAAMDITVDTTLDGVIVVDGAFVVHGGATVTSPTGNLAIYATSITVETGGSIVAVPTGTTPDGAGLPGSTNATCDGRGKGGGYGTSGGVGSGCTGTGGPAFGSSSDSAVSAGSPGGLAYAPSSCSAGPAGRGGGLLKLVASTIVIAGQITANGEAGGSPSCSGWYASGGGSGGGILIAGDQLTVTGSVSAAAGPGGTGNGAYPGGDGGLGRVKLLYGASHNVAAATVIGTRTDGLVPPLTLTSTTQPDPTLVYNDAFTQATFSWAQPFPSRQGYYTRVDAIPSLVPSPANSTFLAAETVNIPRSAFVAGPNYFHIVSIDATSNVGAVQSAFRVVVNTTPPTIASSSHPNPTTWVNNPAVFFSWTLPDPDPSFKGVYYVFDQYGSTLPTATDTFLPITQKQLVVSNVASGVWFFHVVSRDTRDVLTAQAGHYQVRIGTDPGSGSVVGQVVDGSSAPVAGATVTINRGFLTQTTSSAGTYTFTTVPAGTWEVTATKPNSTSTAVKTVTVTANMTANVNLVVN